MRKQKFSGVLILIAIAGLACNNAPEQAKPEAAIPIFDEAAETAAIMKVIDGETDCFFKGDYDCWAKHWSHQNYAFQAWNNRDGSSEAAYGWEKINAQGKDWIEKYYKNGTNVIHPVVKREKPVVKFFSDKSAYLVWKQYNADKEKQNFRVSAEVRIMEKEMDGWKIVNVSAFWDSQKRIPADSLPVK